MNIVIIAPFCSLPGEAYFNRFLYLSKLLAKDHSVTLVTSSFRHFDKKQRNQLPPEIDSVQVVQISEPGYKENVSIRRLWSHYRFCKNFEKWMVAYFSATKVDKVYSAFPLIKTNLILGKYKSVFNYELIIDVQDVWPEAISAAIPLVGSLPGWLIPFRIRANRAYAAADKLMAVSETYLQRAKKGNFSAKGLVVYIGSDADEIANVEPMELGNDETHFVYIGSIGHSYDIGTIIDAFNEYHKDGVSYRLHVIGGGSGLEAFRKFASVRVSFHGFLAYKEMFSIAKGCSFLINPIKSSAPQSITNKLSDYFLLKKTIISSQTNPEVVHLLKSVPSTFYKSGDVRDLKRAIAEAIVLPDFERPSSLLDDFDRRLSYSKIRDFLVSKAVP